LDPPELVSFLDNNGESDLGVVIGVEENDNGVLFKVFLIEDKLSRKKRIEISFEESYQSELLTKHETIDNITYKICMIEPRFITQIYNDRINIGSLDKVNDFTYQLLS